mgnify:CR=1 FL=1
MAAAGAAGGGDRVDRRLVPRGVEHRDPLAVLHDEHRDCERDDQLHHGAPGELGCNQVGVGEHVQRRPLRVEPSENGDRRGANDERADQRVATDRDIGETHFRRADHEAKHRLHRDSRRLAVD